MTYRRALHFAGYRAESFGDIFLLLRAVDEAVARGNFALDASDAADSLGCSADFIGKLAVGGISTIFMPDIMPTGSPSGLVSMSCSTTKSLTAISPILSFVLRLPATPVFIILSGE